MPRTRLWLSTAFGTLLCLGFLLTRGDAQPNTIKEIVKGVWFRQGDLEHLGHCNNIIIEMQDHLIIVDANFPSGARAALEDARRVSSKPVKYVFDTHHHGDHAYGNAVWTQMGAVTLAYQGVADEMKRYEPNRWRTTAKSRPDVAELKRDTAELPKQTFSKIPFVMKDAMRRVEFHFFGWAHTRGDGFVYLPKERVLCTGDAVVNGPYNYTADGNIGNWPKVIEAAQRLKVEHVLPGHGPNGGKDILQGQHDYFVALYQAVQAGVKEGKKPEEVAASLQIPENLRKWMGDVVKSQVKDSYEEITQGKPHGDLPH